MDPRHLRLDLSIAASRAVAVHDESESERHHTTILVTDVRLLGEYGLVPREPGFDEQPAGPAAAGADVVDVVQRGELARAARPTTSCERSND